MGGTEGAIKGGDGGAWSRMQTKVEREWGRDVG